MISLYRFTKDKGVPLSTAILTLLLCSLHLFTFSDNAFAQVDVSPETLETTLGADETADVDFTLQNTSGEAFDFRFPQFSEAARGDLSNAIRTQLEMTQQRAAMQESLDAYRRAVEENRLSETTFDAQTRTAIEAYQAAREEEAANESAGLLNTDGYEIILESATFQGNEFTLYDESPVSGDLEGFTANFVLENGDGGTWSDDLAIIITSTPEFNPENIVLQIGGFSQLVGTAPYVPWASGGLNEPIEESQAFENAVALDEAYIWVGNTWNGNGTWSGEMLLQGLNGKPLFINELSQTTGNIPAGGSLDLSATFSSAGLEAGSYEAGLMLETINAASGEVNLSEIPAALSITTVPQLELSSESLDFGDVFEGTTETLDVGIINTGNAPLVLSNFVSDNDAFGVANAEDGSIEIPAFSGFDLLVSFTPDAPGAQNGSLSFETNVAGSETVSLSLSGSGINAPNIVITPESAALDLQTGQTTEFSFELSNPGSGELNYTIPRFSESLRPESAPRLGMDAITLSPELQGYNAAARELNRLEAFEQTQDEVAPELQERISFLQEQVDARQLTAENATRGNINTASVTGGFPINMDPLTLPGGQFMPISDAVSGTLTSIEADFSLLSGESNANDLAVFIFTTDDTDNVSTEDILLQIGGPDFITTLNYIPWSAGDSNQPGTSISGSYTIEQPEDYEEVYVWIANTRGHGVESSWEGLITLNGLYEGGQLITAVSPASGSVAAGGSETITLQINPGELISGSYTDVLDIFSNAPGNGTARFTLEGVVQGLPGFELSSEALDFGEVFVNLPETQTLEILNTGTAALEISGISTDNTAFTADVETLNIAPFSSGQIEVEVSSAQVGALSGTLSFATNAAGNEQVTLPLSADVVETPAAGLDPGSITLQVDAGETTTAEFSVTNNGSGQLSYSIPRFSEVMRDAGGARLSGRTDELLSRTFAAEQDEQALTRRLMADAFLRGELEGELANEAAGYLQGFEQQPSGDLRLMDLGVGESSDGYLIEMDAFTAEGDAFTLAGQKLSGGFNGYRAQFGLDEGNGGTWTNDLAVLITTSSELSDTGIPEDVLIQIGGFNNYGADIHFGWQGGQSDSPIDDLFEFDSALELEDVYVWVGNAWSSGTGTWSGEIELFGLGANEPFITSAEPFSGVVQPGQAQTIALGLSAEGLQEGIYDDVLQILTNDPVNPELQFTATLNVDGEPEATLSTETLDFGTVFTGADEQRGLEITNTGTGQLSLSQIQAEGNGFSADDAELSLAPGESAMIAVNFTTDQPGSFEGSLSISTNLEADGGALSIPLLAEAVNPGILSLDSESFSFELPLGGVGQDELNITNTGEATLSFDIQSVQLTGSSAASNRESATRARMKQATTAFSNSSSYVMPPMVSGIPMADASRKSSARTDAPTNKNDAYEILFEQAPDGIQAIVSSRLESAGAGIYTTDRFELENSARIGRISSSGYMLHGNSMELPGLAAGIYIYENNGGQPAGYPGDESGNEVFGGVFPLDGDAVNIMPVENDLANYELQVDLGAVGQDFVLGSGEYWIISYLVFPEDTDFWYQMISTEGNNQVQLIDPTDYFGAGATDWTNIESFGIEAPGLAFRIEGFGESFLSTDLVQGSLEPGESLPIALTADAGDLPPGQYMAELRISTNSPATPEVIVPVSLTVGDGEDTGLRWVNLDDPEAITINEGENFHIHGMAAGDEVMQPDGEVHDDLRMWVGFHTNNVHPGEWEEDVWVEGSFHQMHEQEEMAEFMVESGAQLPAGEYFYATRFQMGDHAMAYGGFHSEGGGFWIEGLHVSGQLSILPATSTGDEDNELPEELALNQNYPNPFNPTTQIGYALPESADVRLEVYNMLGQRVAVLVSGQQNAGRYSINFDATNLSSGLYIYRLVAGSQVQTRKMMLVK